MIRRRLNRQAHVERLFRDRINPLEKFDDVELYNKFRFRRIHILAIVDELRGARELPLTRQGTVPPVLQVCVALRFYATGCFQVIIKLYENSQ